jgi:DNA polymerase-3 subunit alpha (Gram-positive type)
LILRVPDTVIADGKENELLEILEKVFCERCGMDFHVSTERVAPKENKKRKMQDQELEQEVAAILQNYEAVKAEEAVQKAEGDEEKKKKSGEKKPETEKQKPAASGGTAEKPKRNTFFQNSDRFGNQKKSDNPDVVYGRDFDGEPITIESITGEIGGVIIRGQVLSVETRELRNEKTLFIFNLTDFTDSIGKR